MKKGKFKILLVDDEKEFVESLSERLQLRNLDAEIAFDGEEALEAVQKGEPDVMVLDLRMPGIDGMEVLRKVKKSHPDMQVVILTGHGTDKDQMQAEKLGAFAYMKKPVDIDSLVKNLDSAWEKLKKLRGKVDNVIMAAAFAQAGEVEIAKETMRDMGKESKKEE